MYLNHKVFQTCLNSPIYLIYLNYPIYLTYVIHQSIKSIKSGLISPNPIWRDLHSICTLNACCMHSLFIWNAQVHPSGGIPCSRGAAQPLQGQWKNSITLQQPVKCQFAQSHGDSCWFMLYLEVILCIIRSVLPHLFVHKNMLNLLYPYLPLWHRCRHSPSLQSAVWLVGEYTPVLLVCSGSSFSQQHEMKFWIDVN